jgi:hypothetical protein
MEEEPSLILAIIMPFMGFPIAMFASILLLIVPIFGIFMFAGIAEYITPLKFTLLGFPLGLFGFTIPYIMYSWKGWDYKMTSILLTLPVILFYSIMLMNFHGMNWLAPDVCKGIYESNVTPIIDFGRIC